MAFAEPEERRGERAVHGDGMARSPRNPDRRVIDDQVKLVAGQCLGLRGQAGKNPARPSERPPEAPAHRRSPRAHASVLVIVIILFRQSGDWEVRRLPRLPLGLVAAMIVRGSLRGRGLVRTRHGGLLAFLFAAAAAAALHLQPLAHAVMVLRSKSVV